MQADLSLQKSAMPPMLTNRLIFRQKKRISRLSKVRWECQEEHCEMNLSKDWRLPENLLQNVTIVWKNVIQGNVENGLIFCGENVDRIHEMTTVHDLMNELCY